MSDSDFNLNSPVIYQTVGGAAGDGSMRGILTVNSDSVPGANTTIIESFNNGFGVIGSDGTNAWFGSKSNLQTYWRISSGRPPVYSGTATQGMGLVPIYGLDNREGLTAADASPITIYATPAGSNGLFRISGGVDVTAYTSGTVTYTITWTDVNGTAHTMTASLSAVGHADLNALGLERVKGGTNITVQLTGTFVATVSVDAASEQAA